MRPPRLLVVLFCLIFFPILLTIFSALTSSKVATPYSVAGRSTGLRAFFSFNIPSSLFPPSAIISLTDDNSTFFLARPAAFGPLLPTKGLSGQLWVGSGFSWDEGTNHKRQDRPFGSTEQSSGISGGSTAKDQLPNYPRSVSQADTTTKKDRDDTTTTPLMDDGTDDHLHHPLLETDASNLGMSQKHEDYIPNKPPAHADIQSLQETAEIQGKVVLLSRGGCGFLEKAKWAQRRGGVALIVGDDTRGGNLVTMYARGDTSNITIPALFTSHTTAHLLSSLMPGHSGETASLGNVLKASQTKQADQVDGSKERVATTTTTLATPSPTASSHSPAKDGPARASHSGGGLLRFIGSLFGLCDTNRGSRHSEDSRRPPSSGNIDWVDLGSSDKKEGLSGAWKRPTGLSHRSEPKVASTLDSRRGDMFPEKFEDDDFVIGVQDWRDPDLLPPKINTASTATTSVTGQDTKTASADKDAAASSNGPQGGSITPGSGEYQSIDKSSANSHETRLRGSEKDSTAAHDKTGSTAKGWFSNHFSWGEDTQKDPQPSLSPSVRGSSEASRKTQNSAHTSGRLSTQSPEHEGLWVTMTPTSISTSPFFDTLLVLVVSPLLTLMVVYALLLLRSRIRRRRWRAPKSVIERLPVRTYHTIATTSSSSSSNSTRPPSPVNLSPTSPLLGNESRPSASRPNRPRSETYSGTMLDPSSLPKEKCNLPSGSTLWRRKYTGRQVECVVCLEEYIDGQSRVMSLPCGHEFHVECITPWLTTRRRTCPICKGDVVRSLTHRQSGDSRVHWESDANAHSSQQISRGGASSAPVLIEGITGDALDAEETASLLDDHANSAPQSSWRNLATLSFSALSGDTIWHQARADRNR
ncbi:hypothetical protein N7461_005805 [Penicillium sp. DV-2018c]|nr:hypothetical protein N7461_005805 [Penicillium sp. DV-2018c]